MKKLKPTVLALLSIIGVTALLLLPHGFWAGQPSNVTASHAGDKVTLCHKGKTIQVSPFAVSAHIAHGDSHGPCGN